MKNQIRVAVVLVAVLNSCTNRELKESNNNFREKNIEKDSIISSISTINEEKYEIFYQKFHTDKTFQLSRIVFPLEGEIYVEGESNLIVTNDTIEVLSKPKYINKKNWNFMTIPKLDKDMILTTNRTANIITERIYIMATSFEIIRNFELKNGKWFLVYYLSKT